MKTIKFFSVAILALSMTAPLTGCASDVPEEADTQDVSEDDLGSYETSEITPEDIEDPSAADEGTASIAEAAEPEDASGLQEAASCRTPRQAINWFVARRGSTALEGLCEGAVRRAWNRRTRHPSAISHWNSSDGARHRNRSAPYGAFIFWNTGRFGHVGLSDGRGGGWSTSVNGRIGHFSRLSYFRNYLGWKPGNCR